MTWHDDDEDSGMCLGCGCDHRDSSKTDRDLCGKCQAYEDGIRDQIAESLPVSVGPSLEEIHALAEALGLPKGLKHGIALVVLIDRAAAITERRDVLEAKAADLSRQLEELKRRGHAVVEAWDADGGPLRAVVEISELRLLLRVLT